MRYRDDSRLFRGWREGIKGQSCKSKEDYARLGRGLVFVDGIAAQQRMYIRRTFGSGRGSGAAGNLGEVLRQFGGSGGMRRAW